jgi:plastocyanin
MLKRVSLVLCCALTACGGGDDPPAQVDAPDNGIDSPPASVMEVTCPGGEQVVESKTSFAFLPREVTIPVDGVVRFENGPSHSIVPVLPDSDDGFRVGFGATTCLKFTRAGTFNYRCNPHTSMTGTITVN